MMGLEHSLDTCSLKIGDEKGSLATLQCWSRGFPITTKLRCRPNWFLCSEIWQITCWMPSLTAPMMWDCQQPLRDCCSAEETWGDSTSLECYYPSPSLTTQKQSRRTKCQEEVGEWSCHAHKMISWEDQLFQTLKLLQLWWNDTLQSIWWKIQEIEIGKVLKALRNWPVLLICCSIKMAEWAAASNLHRQLSGQKIVTQTHCKPSKACAQTEKPSCELVIGK